MPIALTKKLTPVLMVDAIEPCLEFWIKRLGWTQIAAVPEGDRLGFVILAKDSVELMYQTWASVEKDFGRAVPRPRGASVGLFLEVSDIGAIEAQIKGLPRAVERRRTSYGMDEVGVLEPGGHTVVFAQPVGT
ncbi:MAG TPA: hypothetical protein VJN39_01605 [Gemmatimonadales bacterium]|nr:hypothetical protein [Gemmatimonadales bacterium]